MVEFLFYFSGAPIFFNVFPVLNMRNRKTLNLIVQLPPMLTNFQLYVNQFENKGYYSLYAL